MDALATALKSFFDSHAYTNPDSTKAVHEFIENLDNGIKVIDMSEVQSDVLPLVIGLLARIVFSIQQWSTTENRHPIALLCDEAHLYVQQATALDDVAELGLRNFERIANNQNKLHGELYMI